jgi:hypothetical protein
VLVRREASVTVHTTELDETAWEAERDEIARAFLRMGAADFVARYKAGEFDAIDPDGLVAVLAYFPELD